MLIPVGPSSTGIFSWNMTIWRQLGPVGDGWSRLEIVPIGPGFLAKIFQLEQLEPAENFQLFFPTGLKKCRHVMLEALEVVHFSKYACEND